MKLEWHPVFFAGAVIAHGDRSLSLMIADNGKKWGAFAVEMTTSAGIASLEAVNAALNDHAHDVVGEFKNESDARKGCEKYATAWLRKKKRIAACNCGPIARSKQKNATHRH